MLGDIGNPLSFISSIIQDHTHLPRRCDQVAHLQDALEGLWWLQQYVLYLPVDHGIPQETSKIADLLCVCVKMLVISLCFGIRWDGIKPIFVVFPRAALHGWEGFDRSFAIMRIYMNLYPATMLNSTELCLESWRGADFCPDRAMRFNFCAAASGCDNSGCELAILVEQCPQQYLHVWRSKQLGLDFWILLPWCRAVQTAAGSSAWKASAGALMGCTPNWGKRNHSRSAGVLTVRDLSSS